MKLFILISVLAASMLTLVSSCNEEIDFAGDGREIPIIYGLLNQADSIHYVKITRAFNGTNNSLEVAQIPDSSYFQNVSVVIEEFSNGVVTRTWNLNDTLLQNKEPGVFFNPEQKVYYFKTSTSNPLTTAAKYRFKATFNGGEFSVSGETNLVQNLAVTSPSGNGSYPFVILTNNSTVSYNNVSVRINPGDAKVLDARITVYFDEYFGTTPVEKSFTMKIGEANGNEISGSTITFLASGRSFYDLIKANCTNDPSITKREFSKLVLNVTGGTEDLSKYILVNKPSSTLAQNKPQFTNLFASDGRPVIGVFSARSTVKQSKLEWNPQPPYARAIDLNSMKELCVGAVTGLLLFCSDHPSDQGQSYYCN